MMATIEAETINPATVIIRDEAAPVARSGNYEPVRFNAMKHGILSRLAVLAHEDHAEFADLLAALIEEHRPAGMTERHLIEELATIIWRKRRVLLAEGAKINEGLKSAVSSAASVIKSAAPFQRGIGGENADLREFMEGTPEEIAERQRDAALDLAATQKAAAILRKGGPMVKEAEYTPAIKAQTLGEGLQAHRLEKLNRYETHLDRKFERTLAMLLKLKDLRGA